MEGCEESGALDGGADGGQQQGAVVSRGGQPSRVTLAALLAKEAKGFTRGSGGVGGGRRSCAAPAAARHALQFCVEREATWRSHLSRF